MVNQANAKRRAEIFRHRTFRRRIILGFQQVCELLPVAGIDYLGPLPASIQKITVFAAGLHVSAKQPDAARALAKFLTAQAAAPVIRKKGMELG